MKSVNYVSFYSRNLPDAAEPDIISTIKKTFNFGQNEAVHLFQTLMECMKRKELVSGFQQIGLFFFHSKYILNWWNTFVFIWILNFEIFINRKNMSFIGLFQVERYHRRRPVVFYTVLRLCICASVLGKVLGKVTRSQQVMFGTNEEL